MIQDGGEAVLPGVLDRLRVDLDVPEVMPDELCLHHLERESGIRHVTLMDAVPIHERDAARAQRPAVLSRTISAVAR